MLQCWSVNTTARGSIICTNPGEWDCKVLLFGLNLFLIVAVVNGNGHFGPIVLSGNRGISENDINVFPLTSLRYYVIND